MANRRGRPEHYTKAICEAMISTAKANGISLKQYCADTNNVYITLIVALKRHGLSPRAVVAKHTPAALVSPVALMDEGDTENAIALLEGAE